MISIGTVKGQEIKKNRNSDIEVRLLSVQLSNESDVQTVEYFPMAGDDNPPVNEDKVLVVSLGEAFKVAIGIRSAIVASMTAGSKKIYSTSGGSISAFINLLTGGDIELNGNAYSAVRFEELETAFNQLKSDHDLHTHGGVTSGPSSTAPPAASTADISAAESDTVKLL